jgi:hypothetical protein
MYERCLNEAERLLATSKEVIVPIKEVWKLLSAEGKNRSLDIPALTDFNALLEGDKRFEIISAQTEPDEIESLLSEDGEEIDSSLGTLGFYPEDRVKLRRIKLPGDASNGAGLSKESSDDEEVEPFNVKGLSATKPVRRVEAKKQPRKKTASKATIQSPSQSKSRSKKKSRRDVSSRKTGRKSSRKTR